MAGPLTLLDVYSGPEFVVSHPDVFTAYIVGLTYEAPVINGELTVDGGEALALRWIDDDASTVTVNPLQQTVYTAALDATKLRASAVETSVSPKCDEAANCRAELPGLGRMTAALSATTAALELIGQWLAPRADPALARSASRSRTGSLREPIPHWHAPRADPALARSASRSACGMGTAARVGDI